MAHPNARQPRADEQAQTRRRRDDGTLDRMSSMTMAVPDAVRAANPGRDFRWLNDVGSRIHAKTVLDDWDKVTGVDPITVGTDKEGKPLKAYLCMKPEEFVKEDEKRKMARIKEDERGMIQGERNGADKSDLPDSVAYTPTGNRINQL